LRGLPVPLRPCDPVERERELGPSAKVAIVLTHLDRRRHFCGYRPHRYFPRSERLSHHERPIKHTPHRHSTNHAGDYAAAVVGHLNLKLIHKDRPRVVRGARHSGAHIAKDVVSLQLKPLPLAPPLGFVRPQGENHESQHADEANKPGAHCLDPVGADRLQDQ
jgi:hypothetical protein